MNGEVRPERRANRIHCRETRLRKKDYERKLVEVMFVATCSLSVTVCGHGTTELSF